MKAILRRRTAAYVMFALAMGFAGNRLVVYIPGLLGGRGIGVLELAAALMVAAGWFHAGLVTPRRERPAPTGLVLLGGTSVLLVSQSLAPGYAVMAVVLVTCGVVGLGWGSLDPAGEAVADTPSRLSTANPSTRRGTLGASRRSGNPRPGGAATPPGSNFCQRGGRPDVPGERPR